MSDRKKKLEEIKRRKLNLQKQLHEQTGEVIPELNVDPTHASNVTSTTASNAQTRRSTKSFYEDPIRKNVIDRSTLNLINKNLKKSESTDFFLKGIFPETKDEEIQYEEIIQNTKNENDNKKEIIRKNSRRSSKLRQSMDSVKKDEEGENKKKKISDERKNEFIEKNELSFRKFLENQQPILDKYLEINDEYNMGETYYDEEETDVDMQKKAENIEEPKTEDTLIKLKEKENDKQKLIKEESPININTPINKIINNNSINLIEDKDNDENDKTLLFKLNGLNLTEQEFTNSFNLKELTDKKEEK